MKTLSIFLAAVSAISLAAGCEPSGNGKDAGADGSVSDAAVDRQSDAKHVAFDTRVSVLSPDAITEVASDANGVGVKYDLAPDLGTVDDFDAGTVTALDASDDVNIVADTKVVYVFPETRPIDVLPFPRDAGKDSHDVGDVDDVTIIIPIVPDASRDTSLADTVLWGPEVLFSAPDAFIAAPDAFVATPDTFVPGSDTIVSVPDAAPDLAPDTMSDTTPATIPDTAPLCTAGTPCNNVCADTANDSANCGGCNNACPSGNACYAGVCSCYHVEPEAVYGNDHEIHIYCAETHFASVVITNGAIGGPYSVVLRGHPGVDVNGWGPGHHLGAFLSSGDSIDTVKPPVSVTASTNGVTVVVSGQVNRKVGAPYGTWDTSISLIFDKAGKKITGSGSYHVAIPGPLAAAGEDLNLGRMSSNYLIDVPLQCGGVGNTGDTSLVEIERVGLSSAAWDLIDYPASCPTDPSTNMAIDAYGNCNDVDTFVMGLTDPTINSVYKPGLRVSFESLDGTQIMTFCGKFAEGYVAQNCKNYDVSRCPYSDNLGMEHIVKAGSETGTDLSFKLTSLSYAMSGDGASSCCPK